MAKLTEASAILLIKKPEVREAVRGALKAHGFKAEDIVNTSDDKECLRKMAKAEYAIIVLEWEIGADKIQNVLNQSRKDHALEGHPVFLVASRDDEGIIAVAREFFISHIAVGEVTVEMIREQIKGLVKDFQQVGPVRKVLLAIESHRRKGEDRVALEMLTRIHEKQPDNPRIACEFAELLIHAEDWDKAESILRLLIGAPEPHARVRHLYARCRLKKGDHSGATTALKGAQLISPYNIERLLEMGELFLKTDNPSEAEAAFSKALAIAPHLKAAKLGRSTSKLLMGEVNEALQILQGVANPRELSAVFNTAAIMAIHAKRFESGMGLYQKATELLAKDAKLSARIFYNMGIGFVKSKQGEKAIKCFQKAIEKDPSFTDAKHNIRVLSAAMTAKGSAAGPASKADASRDFLTEFDEKISASMPLTEFGIDSGAGEEVELDDLFNEIDKVG